MNTSDFAQRLADKLIAQLKEGTAPWQKPWVEGQSFSPYNPTTGNRYRGINVLALLGTDFSDPRWMTYKQAQAQGWQVRGGERSTQIQHWIWEEERVRVGKDGQPVLDSQKKFVKDLVRLERPKVITAAVFNAEQIDGIPALEPERTYDWDPVEQAEKLLQASGAKSSTLRAGELIIVSRRIPFACRRRIGLRHPAAITARRCTSWGIGRVIPTGSIETLATHSVQKGTPGRSSGLKLRV